MPGLSVAGARAGLAGARSGLFMEQVRVIKEMRAADIQRGRSIKHIRPRFGVWENVPGAFSSGSPKGEDFRIVLEEFLRISFDSVYVPRPYTGRWESAGRILLGDTFSLAWRVFDTQYWPGTPQRRRRIYLVVDFGGETAPKILFPREHVPGLFGGHPNGGNPCRSSCGSPLKSRLDSGRAITSQLWEEQWRLPPTSGMR